MSDVTSSPTGKESAEPVRSAGDQLISIADVRGLFKLGRTAAYDLTHRADFPDPIEISPRCYRWWASEVDDFASTLRRVRPVGRKQGRDEPHLSDPGSPPLRITGSTRTARSRKEAS